MEYSVSLFYSLSDSATLRKNLLKLPVCSCTVVVNFSVVSIVMVAVTSYCNDDNFFFFDDNFLINLS